MTSEEVVKVIEANLAGATASVTDMTGTGDHFSAEVITPSFDGVSMIKQHRMVYDALGDLMQGPIHALQLSTRAS
jgi:stress-induced morphogen